MEYLAPSVFRFYSRGDESEDMASVYTRIRAGETVKLDSHTSNSKNLTLEFT